MKVLLVNTNNFSDNGISTFIINVNFPGFHNSMSKKSTITAFLKFKIIFFEL